ncbi:MAG: tripartite tricarboxylate transporter substrate-binding protein [Alphaproteobacteria bacterium]|nr:tripartite tricarboxylate transporter substrate-binding protein [Alphaproteobacteria bacterium]
MKALRTLIGLGVIGVLFGWALPQPVQADAVADFYKGKTITLYIGYSAGGGYDTYARTIGRVIGKHIPGNPKVIAKNRPGAGSLKLTNELYNSLPKDGTAIGTFGRGMVMEPLFGNKKAKFDPAKFTWLGSANNEVSVCIAWHESPIQTLDDFLTKPMIVGGTGPGSDTDVFPKVLNNIIGTKLRLVTGYPGGNDINLATERGEVEGRCGYSWSSLKSRFPQWLTGKKVQILLQMSTAKHPDLPDVPFVMDLAKTERDRKILELVFARQAWGRPFAAPPNLPADRAKALQAAFMATMKDPDFLEDAKKQKLEIAPISGEKIGQLIAQLYASPKDIVEAAKEAAEKTGKIKITKVVIPIETVKGTITKIKRKGRRVSYKGGGRKGKLSVSGRRTKVSIGGKKAKRKKLKVGMKCEFTFQGSAAKKIACE